RSRGRAQGICNQRRRWKLRQEALWVHPAVVDSGDQQEIFLRVVAVADCGRDAFLDIGEALSASMPGSSPSGAFLIASTGFSGSTKNASSRSGLRPFHSIYAELSSNP